MCSIPFGPCKSEAVWQLSLIRIPEGLFLLLGKTQNIIVVFLKAGILLGDVVIADAIVVWCSFPSSTPTAPATTSKTTTLRLLEC
jgi:hypothetical protein